MVNLRRSFCKFSCIVMHAILVGSPCGLLAGTDPGVTVALDNSPALGTRKATVGIVEFSDYQCPFCGRFHARTFMLIKQKYIDTGQILYVYWDYPMDFHAQAKPAAIAANCAGEQGAYWAMQRRLYADQRRLSPEFYEELAGEMRLNAEAFNACVSDPQQAGEVDKDLAYAKSIGIYATPSFVVGRVEGTSLVKGKVISGVQSLATFSRVIDELLNEGN